MAFLVEDIHEYLEWKSSYAERAGEMYQPCLKAFLELFPESTSEAIGIRDIARFQNTIRPRFQDSTVAYYMIIIKNFFMFLKRQGRGVIDPYFVKVPLHHSKPHEPVTVEEFLAMDATLRNDDFHELQRKVVLHFLYFTGVRVSEICSMTMSMASDQPRMLIPNRKNRRYRWVFWPEGPTHELYLKYLGIRKELAWGPALFTNKRSVDTSGSGHFTTRSIQRWVAQLSKDGGLLRRISCHCFRTHRIQEVSKVNLMAAKEAAGHSSIVSTQPYLNYDPGYIEEVVRETF